MTPVDNRGSIRHLLVMAQSTLAERFWSKVDKNGPIIRPELGPCWIWTAATTAGYGEINIEGTPARAHRVSYLLANGPVPDDLFICHKCDTRNCVRPDHLWAGTNQDNMRDAAAKGRVFAQTQPERVVRGDKHYSRLHPERLARGERQGSAKLTADQVRAIRGRYAAGKIGQRQLAREFGVSHALIGGIVNRRLWTHVD